MNIHRTAFLVLLGITAVPSQSAETVDDILSKIINVPAPSAIRVDGGTGKLLDDSGVQGGKALRVEVAARGDTTWATAIATPIKKPVKSGDKLLLAFWARVVKGDNGATTALLPYNAVQLAGNPYTALFNEGLTIGPEWKIYEVKGKADKDYSAGTLNVAIHLATGKQTIDLGPIFVLNLGQ